MLNYPIACLQGNLLDTEKELKNPRFNIFGKKATGAKRPERNKVGINNNLSIDDAFLSRNISMQLLTELKIELGKIRKSILWIKIKLLN